MLGDVVGPPVAACNPDVADKVPSWVENGAKTSGMLEVGDGAPVEIASGESELNAPLKVRPPGSLPGTGSNPRLWTGIEAQTATYMRLNNVDNATLYINRAFCGDIRPGCL